MDVAWFKRRQKQAGITAEAIASELGRDRTVVSRIYHGRQRMTFEYAQVFARLLDVPLSEVLEHAGLSSASAAQELEPGFRESDVVPWVPDPGSPHPNDEDVARALCGSRNGLDVWVVRSRAMLLAGYHPGDRMVVDISSSMRPQSGHVVVAQVYDLMTGTAKTVLRRFRPPVLVTETCLPEEAHAEVVDDRHVAIRGVVVGSWRRP